MATQEAKAGKLELGHVPISMVSLSSIRPSAKNQLLYRPVDPDDPDIRNLAESIRAHGLKEPLVITADHVILSGHRRSTACRLAGLKEVACRIERIRSTDPQFLTLLREYNRQRVKNVAEIAREEILSADPEPFRAKNAVKVSITSGTPQGIGKGTKLVPTSKHSSTRLERSTFVTSRLLEFFSEKELAMQIGHPSAMWALALLKELIDNSLDGAEAAGVNHPAPRLTIVVEENALSVQDNGPGIPAETISRSLDYTSRVSNKAHYVSPTRGALGNALMCVWAAPLVIDGNQGRAEVIAQGVRHDIKIALDRIAGKPSIEHITEKTIVRNGTFLKVHWNGIASCLNYKWPDSYNATYLLRAFAIFNPHASFSLAGVEDLSANNPSWKKWRPDQQTCPHWYSSESLRNLIAAYLAEEYAGGKAKTVREFVAEFGGLSSTAKTKAVLADAGLSGAKLADLVIGEDVDLKRIVALLQSMKAAARPVKSAALGHGLICPSPFPPGKGSKLRERA